MVRALVSRCGSVAEDEVAVPSAAAEVVSRRRAGRVQGSLCSYGDRFWIGIRWGLGS